MAAVEQTASLNRSLSNRASTNSVTHLTMWIVATFAVQWLPIHIYFIVLSFAPSWISDESNVPSPSVANGGVLLQRYDSDALQRLKV